MEKKYDVIAVGNAIVDILGKVEDHFLTSHDLTKGAMILAEEEKIAAMYRDLRTTQEASGGSAANTIAGIASLGGKAAFIGKVKDDAHGQVFEKDLTSLGVTYTTPKATDGAMTAQSMIAITPDAERTMVTYLGATKGITDVDIDEELIAQSKILYLEGYLWDEPHAKAAMRQAVTYAKKHGCEVSLSLSDSFCVHRHREEFLELINDHIDILFCNMDELTQLFQTDIESEALYAIANKCELVAATKGSEGSLIVHNKETITIPAIKNIQVMDTTGAGDLYASGFLYGYANGLPIDKCGELASLTASEIISHIGARPQTSLAEYTNLKSFKAAS